MDLFELVGTIAIKGVDAAKEALGKTSEEGEKTQSKLSKAFSAVGRGAAVVGKAVGTGLVVAGGAMAGLTVKAVNLSGELEQNMGGSEAVFGQYAGKMQDTAKNAFSNMGLSTSDYLATANKMGALFQGAGFSVEESMGLSSSAMQRAADVASIMGIDTSSAMEAIAGAAKGNFTMMDNLGVAMNDTTLQAYALEKGINKSTSEMTNQEKIGLAMEMFMEKTAYAAGNYAKENETLAGSLSTAKSALTNFLDGSGDVNQLVDAFSNAAEVIVKNVSEIAPRLVSGITDIVNKVVPMIPPLLNQLLPVIIEGAISLINGLVAAMPTVISALMSALPALIDGMMQIMNALIQALPQLMETFVSALPTLIPQLVNGLVSMIVTLCTSLPQIIQPIIDYLPEIITAIVTALIQNLPALIVAGGQLLLGLLEGMIKLIGKIPEVLKAILDGIVNGIKSLFGIHSPSTVMMEIGKSIMQGLINGVKALLNGISAVWNTLKQITLRVFNAIKTAIITVWNGIKSGISTAINAIKNVITTIWNGIKSVTTTVWNAIKTAITTVVNGIKTVITTVWNAIKTAITTVINSIKSVITTVWNAIKSTISSVMNGIKSTISSIWNGIKSVVSSAVNGVKSTVSNVFNSVKSTVSNVWNGIKSAIQKPIESARDLVKGAIDKIKGFFSFKISWPKIPMPHFGISPSGWKIGDLLKGSIPKLSIDWYAKGGVMTRPTLFDYNPATGTAKVGGENGAEAIAPIDTLQKYIRTAVQDENSVMIQKLERIIELLTQFFPDVLAGMDQVMVLDDGTLVAKMAPAMDAELGKIAIKKGRGR